MIECLVLTLSSIIINNIDGRLGKGSKGQTIRVARIGRLLPSSSSSSLSTVEQTQKQSAKNERTKKKTKIKKRERKAMFFGKIHWHSRGARGRSRRQFDPRYAEGQHWCVMLSCLVRSVVALHKHALSLSLSPLSGKARLSLLTLMLTHASILSLYFLTIVQLSPTVHGTSAGWHKRKIRYISHFQ